MARDYSVNPQYMDDDDGNPHWHVDWSPSPEHLAAIKGTSQQRQQWEADEIDIVADAIVAEDEGKFDGAGENIISRL